MNLSKDHIEEQILLFVDAELDEAAAQQLMEYIDLHPEYQAMLDAYMMTRADNSEDLIYPDKDALLQQETEVVAFRHKPKRMYWAAAAVLFITAGTAFYYASNRGLIAETPVMIAKSNRVTIPSTQPESSDLKDTVVTTVVLNLTKAGTTKSRPIKEVQPAVAPVQEVQMAPRNEEITRLALPQELIMQQTAVAIVGKQQLIATPQLSDEEGNTDRLPGWLPVNEENLQGLNDLVARIQVLKEDIQEQRSKLRNKSFVIQLGQKEIILGKKINNQN